MSNTKGRGRNDEQTQKSSQNDAAAGHEAPAHLKESDHTVASQKGGSSDDSARTDGDEFTTGGGRDPITGKWRPRRTREPERREKTTEEVVAALKEPAKSVMSRYFERQSRVVGPRFKTVEADGTKKWTWEYGNNFIDHFGLMHAFATADQDFANGIVDQLTRVGSQQGVPDEVQMNFMLSVIKAIEARDCFEVMLGAQIAAVQKWAMAMAAHSGEFKPYEEIRLFDKLTTTYAKLIEALDRHRRGGEQKVTVNHQHVSVSDGGQAIVGNVTTPPASALPPVSGLPSTVEKSSKKTRRSTPAIAARKEQPMAILGDVQVGSVVPAHDDGDR